jgi:hypothetical protein
VTDTGAPPEGWAEHVRHFEVDGIRWAPADCLICSGIHMHHVTLSCGHEWDESYPGEFDADDPRLQERACGHPDHYPTKFAATYSPLVEKP